MSESLRAGVRDGCCAEFRKPCQYHEGWDDGYEAKEMAIDAAFRKELPLGPQGSCMGGEGLLGPKGEE